MSSKQQATVKWFDHAKGYGFLTTPNGDALVHYSDIEQTGYKGLKEGQQVEFIPEATDKGLTATHVIPMS